MLVKNPGFTFVAIVSIAIGVGANAATFSLADTLVFRPLTVPRASEIVTVTTVTPRSGFAPPTSAALSYADYVDVRDRSRSFSGLVGFQLVVAGVSDGPNEPAQRKFGMAVSGNMFDALGVQPVLGRAFGIEEDRVAGRNAVVVLDYDAWRKQYGGDPGIVGRLLRIGGIEMTVIGVMPERFTGPDQWVLPSYYVPLAMLPRLLTAQPDVLTRRDIRNVAVKGRLTPGVSLAQAAEEVELIGSNLERAYPDTNRNRGLTVRSEFGARVDARPQLAVAAAIPAALAVVVLLVACANVAGLLSSRAPARAREMALRLSIGAGRPRLMRQLIVESLMMAAGGATAGLLVGYGVIAIFAQIQIPTDVPLKLTFELDRRAMLVGIGIAALSAIASSLVPAWRSTGVDLARALKSQAAGDGRRTRLWGRNLLVCGQVALSLVMLTIAVFLYRGFAAEVGRGAGFRTERILTMGFQPDLAGYDGPRAQRFYRLLKERTQTIPGVQSVALTSSVPMDSISIESTMVVPEGFQFPAGTESVRVRSAHVDESYFATLEISLLHGRAFSVTDRAGTPRVAVVNQAFAARYWPGQDVVGKRLRLTAGDRPAIEIVGVAAAHKQRAIAEGPTEFVYYPLEQDPVLINKILVASESDPAALVAPLREVVRSIDPNMPVFDVRTMDDLYSSSAVALSNLAVETVGGMGAMGLVMTVVGLYGLVAYSVSRRTKEIGLRMAVGASPVSVLRMVLRQGTYLALVGIVLGLAASAAIEGALEAAFPFPNAPNLALTTYLFVVPALLAIALLAAYVPARRAALIDPVVTLRE
jgi:predicted permease